MHLPGDAARQLDSSVESRINWYFEAATLAFELSVRATMQERGCSQEEAVAWLDQVYRRRFEEKLRGR
ncbi:MAG: hypothetical protein KF760_08015 [Candidatus Eremiobacteraeota bacterium]|nr:hypothetical protein [Candidatus Eremiobacteraeota bacterium]MCW5867987.1 hypothetical protein [Candidatus Eremiobacteraeota bacterium]